MNVTLRSTKLGTLIDSFKFLRLLHSYQLAPVLTTKNGPSIEPRNVTEPPTSQVTSTPSETEKTPSNKSAQFDLRNFKNSDLDKKLDIKVLVNQTHQKCTKKHAHTKSTAGRVSASTVYSNLSESISLLVNAGIDPQGISTMIYNHSFEGLRTKLDILQEFDIKPSIDALTKFSRIISSSLSELHQNGYLVDPKSVVENIIMKLPISRKDREYLSNHPSLKNQHSTLHTLQYISHEIVNIYCAHKLGKKADKNISFFSVKKFRRLHETIRLIDLLSSPEVYPSLGKIACDLLITRANPETIEFLLKNPKPLSHLKLSKLIVGHNTTFLSMKPEEIMHKLDLFFKNLGFSQACLVNTDVFVLSDEKIMKRSEFWFKELGKELVTSTPKSSLLVSSFRKYETKYKTMQLDDPADENSCHGQVALQCLLGTRVAPGRSKECESILASVYQKHGWNFDKVSKRIDPKVVNKTLGIDGKKLCYEDADKIADYLLNEVKLSPEQVFEVPTIFGFGLPIVQEIISQQKHQIDSQEWKDHSLSLDFVLYSYCNSQSPVSGAFDEECAETY